MSERDEYQAGVPCWVDIAVPDPQAALGFYGELFRWDFEGPGAMPDGGEYYVARVRGRDVAGVSSEAPGAPPQPAWTTYISVTSADHAAERAESAGGRTLAGPFDAPPAGRMAVLADPAGAVFCVWEPQTRQGAQLVNEPSAWSWSNLNTPDPEAARRFYAAVFGWEYDSFEMGGTEFTMCRVPGYVGGEPEQPVSRDVVAGMASSADGPAHWGVDFWVADADAAAEDVARLGGRVVAAPYDTPITRQAVVADPAGAVFSVSKVPGT